jgi:hypothetical protein
MKEQVAITVPIYKVAIDDIELVSLTRCLKILHRFKIIFFAPQSLNVELYEKFCAGKVNFSIERFADYYFEDIDCYNKLMLSTHFYKRFLPYKFILIYQLDAFVFKDELLYWCDQNYDYIGAPHVPHNNLPGEMRFLKNYKTLLRFAERFLNIKHKISNVGNGGLSLRKTKSLYYLLKILKNQSKKWTGNEDGFFKYWGNLFYPFFKLAPDKIALSFSIETSPKESLEKLNNNLPFGCHAFQKHDEEAWTPHIDKS